MDKLRVGLARLLPLTVIVLLLPSIAAAQCVSQLTVQSVLTQDAGGNNKTTFAPGESIHIVGQVNNAYGAYMLAANGAQVAVRSSFYNDTKRVDIPPGVSTWSWNVTAPSQQSSYTVTVSAFDHFCGVLVSRSATFAVGQGTGPSVILERALTHNGVGEIGQEQTTFAPGDTIRYAAIVNNPGGSTVTPRFDFKATGPREIFSWTGDVPIPPGIWYFHLHVSVPTDAPAGSYTHRVTMTYNGQTTTKESSFTVGLTGTLPDLTPTAILYNPANLVAGATVFFDSGIQNSGAQGTVVFNIRWFVDNVSLGYGSHAGVPANSTVLDGNSQFSWVATAGIHTITFAVDVDNHVVESDESNNSRSVTITVASQTAQPPVITLLGDNPLYHTQGCPFVGAGATALDAKDGDLTNSILITGTEQINNPGVHTITYTVTNSSWAFGHKNQAGDCVWSYRHPPLLRGQTGGESA